MDLSGSRPLKLFFLAYYFAVGGSGPYIALYLQAIHFDGAQIGLVASITPLAGMLLPPFWGLLSDRRGWRTQLLIASLVGAALCSLIVPLGSSFLWVLFALLLLAICLSPATPLANAAVLEWVQRNGGSFGSIRIFGSFGYLIASVIMGLVLQGKHILWLYAIYGVLLLITAAVSLLIPPQQQLVRQDTGAGIRDVLRDPAATRFLLWTIVAIGSWAAYNTFFSLYMKGLGAGTGVLGLASGLATISELPAMALVGPLMRRIGVKPLILISLAISTVRWLALSQLHDYHIVLALQPLHGVMFAFFYVGGVTFVDQRLPEQLRATGQSLFNAAGYGMGAVVGANLFGMLLDRAGASGIFLLASLISAVACLAMALTMPSTAVRAS